MCLLDAMPRAHAFLCLCVSLPKLARIMVPYFDVSLLRHGIRACNASWHQDVQWGNS